METRFKVKFREQFNIIVTEGGGDGAAVVRPLSVISNGTYIAPLGIDGFSPVKVNVPSEKPDLEKLTVTKNGTYKPTDADGYSEVTVNVKTESSGREPVTEEITIDENGVYNAPYGVDGYSKVTVNVPSEKPITEPLSVTANGTYSPDDGVDGYSKVTVNVPSKEPVTEEKTINANGIYTPSIGVDGYSKVTVDVQPDLQEKTVNANGKVTPDSGYDGLSEVIVNVQPKLQEKTATESGEVIPDEGYDGLSKVVVNVPAPSGGNTLKDLVNFTQSMYGWFQGLTKTPDDWEALIPYDTTENVTNMYRLFQNVKSATLPLLDTRKVYSCGEMFVGAAVSVVPAYDFRTMNYSNSIFNNMKNVTEIWVKNIQYNIQVGSGETWGHLLTVESLIHLIRELRNAGKSNTFTVGSANLAKLEGIYVRTIDITDEMRAEDDLIDEKLPFEVCESTDDGAMKIEDYLSEKNWQIA